MYVCQHGNDDATHSMPEIIKNPYSKLNKNAKKNNNQKNFINKSQRAKKIKSFICFIAQTKCKKELGNKFEGSIKRHKK